MDLMLRNDKLELGKGELAQIFQVPLENDNYLVYTGAVQLDWDDDEKFYYVKGLIDVIEVGVFDKYGVFLLYPTHIPWERIIDDIKYHLEDLRICEGVL